MAEVELNYTNLTEMQDTLLAKINTDMDPKDAEATLKMFDSVNKALAEERKNQSAYLRDRRLSALPFRFLLERL